MSQDFTATVANQQCSLGLHLRQAGPASHFPKQRAAPAENEVHHLERKNEDMRIEMMQQRDSNAAERRSLKEVQDKIGHQQAALDCASDTLENLQVPGSILKHSTGRACSFISSARLLCLSICA